jgi:hypothetical protein
MGRYMHFEENDDGTTTITTDIGGIEQTFVTPLNFDEMAGMMNTPENEATVHQAAEQMIYVPDTIE